MPRHALISAGRTTLIILALVMLLSPFVIAAAFRPNILWIILDDMSPTLSCYGEKVIKTPSLDRLAREGTRFANAIVTAPVCSPSRSALITGMYQTTIGAHNHRSGRGIEKIHLPAGIEPIPLLFQRAGYFTANGGWPAKGKNLGKTDYNFEWDAKMYDSNDWAGRKPGQPFFAQIQLPGGKLRDGRGLSEAIQKTLGTLTPPESVNLPPYYPEDPVIRKDWASYLDAARYTDGQVGEILKRLEREKLLEQTVIFILGDNGISVARGKQFLYDEGIKSPLIIRGPGIPKDKVRHDLVEHIDMAASALALAGIPIPKTMQARDILARDYRPRDAVFAARDRCDETVDGIRALRTLQFKYIRNFYPDRPHLQPNVYKDNKPTVTRLRELHAQGKLTGLPEQLLFISTRAPEELYDLATDPFETHNLAADPSHRATLLELRARLDQWMADTRDQGRQPEAEKMYDSDMAEYLGGRGGKNVNDSATANNIRLMKQWIKEKPLKVNP